MFQLHLTKVSFRELFGFQRSLTFDLIHFYLQCERVVSLLEAASDIRVSGLVLALFMIFGADLP